MSETGDARWIGKSRWLERPAGCSVGAVGGLALERALQQNGDLLILDAAGSTGTQFVIESGQSMLDKTLPPLAHRSISSSADEPRFQCCFVPAPTRAPV